MAQHIQISDRLRGAVKMAQIEWGPHAVSVQTMGECAELIAAINRWTNQGRSGAFDQVIEETGDVAVMIAQMIVMLTDEVVGEAIERSLAKLETKLAKSAETATAIAELVSE